jgi:hypothetical protein
VGNRIAYARRRITGVPAVDDLPTPTVGPEANRSAVRIAAGVATPATATKLVTEVVTTAMSAAATASRASVDTASGADVGTTRRSGDIAAAIDGIAAVIATVMMQQTTVTACSWGAVTVPQSFAATAGGFGGAGCF